MLAIAHDLRSPLTTITGSADLLPGEKDGRRKAKYVENIRHTSEYILSLVDTLMDFYLLDTGQEVIRAYLPPGIPVQGDSGQLRPACAEEAPASLLRFLRHGRGGLR